MHHFFGEFPMSLWDGGRPSNYDQCDEAFVKNVIKNIDAKGTPVRYTYTNMLLNEEDLNDPWCNFCMKEVDNGMNEVMIFSPVLEKYIRENYPSYKLNSSTCKEIRDIVHIFHLKLFGKNTCLWDLIISKLKAGREISFLW